MATIYTLDPNKFAEKNQQPLHLGNRESPQPYIWLYKQSSFIKLSVLEYDRDRSLRIPYPPDTKAFLYYSISPEKPRIAGELRLRVTSSDDAASFESGSDLLRLNGRPWSRPLPSLPKHYFPLYEKLREEGLVSDDLDRVVSSLSSKLSDYRGRPRLYTLNDTFIVDFSYPCLYFLVITENSINTMPIISIFVDHRKTCKDAPYTGAFTPSLATLVLIILMNL